MIVISIEAIAGAGIIQYWFHDIPLWLTSLILTIVLTLTNVYSVKSFGEFEYWFSLIKVVTIIAFLIVGFAFIFGFAPGSEPVGFSNLTGKGGFFPEGISSVLLGIVVVIFSFMGTEIVAIAAGETSNPIESVTKATRSVVWRIIVFYVGSIAIVVALLPWNSANILESPFVAVLEHIGVPAAAQIMNFIVLTAVLSCLNSGLYTTSRMLYSLAERNEAPRRFMKLSKKAFPYKPLWPGHFLLYRGRNELFFTGYRLFILSQLIRRNRFTRLSCHRRFPAENAEKTRKTNPEALKIKMWLFPFLTYLTIIAICGILVSMAFIDSMRDELLLTGVITGIVLISYLVFRKRKVSEKAAANPVTQQQPDILP